MHHHLCPWLHAGSYGRQQLHDAISQGVATHAPKAKVDGVLVQRQQNGIAELIVGITQDPTFGPTLTLGLGGTLTEIYKDTSHALLPVDTNHIIRMLKELKAFALLDGFRGRPKADLSAIANTVMGITQAYEAGAGAIKELEVNPLLVNEKGAVALDALMIYSTE